MSTPTTEFPAAPYAPPYPTMALDQFAWAFEKTRHEGVAVQAEVGLEVVHGGAPVAYYTADFVLTVDGRRVAVEMAPATSLVDHDRRLRRDATLLAAGAVDAVFRLRERDVADHPDDVLFVVSQMEPGLFSERGRINLRTLASPEAASVVVRPEQPSVLVPYALGAATAPDRYLWHVANGQAPHVLVRRLDRRFPDVWRSFAAVPIAPTD